MRVLVWQWGRRGAGPRLAALLARGIAGLPGTDAALALSAGAEILQAADAPRCAFLLPRYASPSGLLRQMAGAPLLVARLTRDIRRLRPERAVCAMPAPLDLLMLAALRRARVPVTVIVHDADPHPGDIFPLQYRLNRLLIRRADAVVVLSGHVAARLRAQGLPASGTPLLVASHPPFDFAPRGPVPERAAGTANVLSFGRLLPYKGLDLLAQALAALGPRAGLAVRVVGHGPESPALAALRALPGVAVENRWVPEDEIGDLVAWADIVVLPYREASQSGIAAAALAQGRRVLATRVGGLPEQLAKERLATLCDPDAASIAAGLDALVREPPSPTAPAPDGKEAWREFASRLIPDERDIPVSSSSPRKRV